jgi:hypothetical protein
MKGAFCTLLTPPFPIRHLRPAETKQELNVGKTKERAGSIGAAQEE